jgi:hypothetical protein
MNIGLSFVSGVDERAYQGLTSGRIRVDERAYQG